MVLYRASGWRYLVKIIERLYDQVLVFRSDLYRRYGQNAPAVMMDNEYLNDYMAEHNKILLSLRERNPEKVRENMVYHIKNLGFESIYHLYELVIQKESQEFYLHDQYRKNHRDDYLSEDKINNPPDMKIKAIPKTS